MKVDGSSQLDLSLPLDVSRLAASRQAVRAFLAAHGVPQRCSDDLVLCLQEALKNAMRFSHSSPGVNVRVRITAEGVTLLVRDYGVGLDGASAPSSKSRGRPIRLPPRVAVCSSSLRWWTIWSCAPTVVWKCACSSV